MSLAETGAPPHHSTIHPIHHTKGSTHMLYQSLAYGDSTTLVVIGSSVQATISETHPKFGAVQDYFERTPEADHDEAYVSRLLDAETTIGLHLQSLSERVSYSGGRLFFDGDPVRSALSDRVVELVRADQDADVDSLVNFLENLSSNPDPEVRESLWEWVESEDVTLTRDGKIIGYKSVDSTDGLNLSWSTGTTQVFVDGEPQSGRIPNPLGAVVTVPRSEVDSSKTNDCSYGLHVGTWSYASTFHTGSTQLLLVVEVNPRDVVGGGAGDKFRTCRYRVLHATSDKYSVRTFDSTDRDAALAEVYARQDGEALATLNEVQDSLDADNGVQDVQPSDAEAGYEQAKVTLLDIADNDPRVRRILRSEEGHKPAARRIQELGYRTSEASVRRYRKSHA